MTVVVDVENRSGLAIDEDDVANLARRVMSERVRDGEVAVLFVGPDEIRRLKKEHLGVDEATDVLAFAIDGAEELPDDLPRHVGDVVVCPEATNGDWRVSLVHGLLHLIGYDHGAQMTSLERSFT